MNEKTLDVKYVGSFNNGRINTCIKRHKSRKPASPDGINIKLVKYDGTHFVE